MECTVTHVDFGEEAITVTVRAPAELAPAEIARGLRQRTETAMRAEYRELRAIPSLWTSGYLVATGDRLDPARVKQFIEAERRGDEGTRILVTAPPD